MARLVFALCLLGSVARADVVRFAVVVGNNKGLSSDGALRYAESDAAKMAEVLRDLGGFDPANIVLLHDEDGQTFARTLIAVNDRIRVSMARPDTQVLLFVYFSGHADANALHLAGTRLELQQLEQLVRGSAATFRVLMLDACRSGALTRLKGGTTAPPFDLEVGERLTGEGLAYMTSSSGNEDAQESDELRGAIFTHHFVSALVGAGDADGDGRISLEEAYRYAFDATVRSTSRTWAGLQHPAFRYDLRGAGNLVLTTPEGARAQRAMISFPPNRTYVVMTKDANGAVVAEVDAVDRARRISVRPGRYFIRGRLPDALLEGTIDVTAGSELAVGDAGMRRTDYARLVRKGGFSTRATNGLEAGYELRTQLKNSATPCNGGYVGWEQHRRPIDFGLRLDACYAMTKGDDISARVEEAGAEAHAEHAWDVPRVTFAVGLSAGVAWLHQSFTTDGLAPARDTAAGRFGVHFDLVFPLRHGLSIALDSAGLAYVFRQMTSTNGSSVGPWFAFRETLGLQKEW